MRTAALPGAGQPRPDGGRAGDGEERRQRRRPPAGRAGHGRGTASAAAGGLLLRGPLRPEAILAARTPQTVTSWTDSPGRGGGTGRPAAPAPPADGLGAAGPVQRAPRTGAADPRKETSMTSAISTAGLSKDTGRGEALRPRPRGPGRRDLRLPGAQRRRQDHHHQAADGDDPSSAGSASVLGWTPSATPWRSSGGSATSPASCPSSAGCAAARSSPTSAGCAEASTPGRVKELASRFDLDLGQRFREYSRGNKQKLAIPPGLMHGPDLLVLDEPTEASTR